MGNLMRIKTAIAAGAAAAFLTASPAVAAGSKGTSLPVQAQVNANCTITAQGLNFGVIDTISATAVNGTGGVTVTCTNGASWTAAADVGAGSGATFASRQMTSNGNTLSYSLFTDTNRTIVWGDGSSSTSTITNTGTGTAQAITIYGRVPGGQTSAPAGEYTDTVSVTLTY